MRTFIRFAAAVSCCALWVESQAQPAGLDIGPDWRSRTALAFATNQLGVVALQTNTVVEIGAGMNRWDTNNGQWVASSPQLTITDQGVVGQGARHGVILAANVNTAGGIQVELPGQGAPQWFKSHLLGLFYEDRASRTNVLIADLQDSAAQVVGENQVYYFSAFTGLNADLRYTYTSAGLLQEVLFRERLPDPAAWGLSNSVRLVAITELVEGPEPQLEQRLWTCEGQTETDETLDFGPMRMVPGLAFGLGSDEDRQRAIPVTKEYRTQNGRRLILERVRCSDIREQLLELPPRGSNTNGTASIQKVSRWLAKDGLPSAPKASNRSIHAVRNNTFTQTAGFVLDWDFVNNVQDFTFHSRSSATYVIVSQTHLSGTTSISPGAIVRLQSDSLYVEGPLNLLISSAPGGIQRPILTSVLDQSVGAVAWDGGPPSARWGGPALVVRSQDYTNVVRQIEARHPGARIIPDRPTALPSVRVDTGNSTAATVGGGSGTFTISRRGGDWSQPLTVGYGIGSRAGAGMVFRTTGSSVTIPANQGSVEVQIQPSALPFSAPVVTLAPDTTGAYVADGPLTASAPLLIANGSPSGPVQAPSGLVGWWKGETNTLDSSGNNQTGTIHNNVIYNAGEVGGAFQFDGVSSYVEVTNETALRLTSQLTVELWVKRLRLTGAPEYLVEKGGDWTMSHQNYSVSIHPNNGLCFTYNGGYRIAGDITNLNHWYHCAVVATNNTADPAMYIDGVLQTTKNTSGGVINLANSTLPLHIGAQVDPSYSYYGQTLVDETSIYNRGLSSNEIWGIYNAGSFGKTLNPPPACTTITPGPSAWWPADSNTNDIIGNNNGIYSGSYPPGEVGQAFNISSSGTTVRVPAASALNIGTANGMTIECWVNPADNSGRPIVEWEPSSGFGVHVWANFPSQGYVWVNLVDTSGANHCFSSLPNLLMLNTFQHLAVTYDKTSGYCQLFLNGSFIQQTNLGIFTPQTSPDFYIGYRPNGGDYFYGLVDELSLYNRVLGNTELGAIFTAGRAGKCHPSVSPPTITTQPQSQTVIQGGNATFTVVASGSAPLTNQWQKNGASIAAATSTSYTITSVQPSDAATYSVVVSNPGGNVTSSGAVLTVIIPPSISVQPANQSVQPGANATFCVTATGTAPLSYQWQFNSTNIGGATASCYTVINAGQANVGNYAVVVSNPAGNITSANAALTLTCFTPPSGLVAWWRAEGNPNDSVGANNGQWVGTANYANGEVGQAFYFSPVGSTNFVQIPDSASLQLTNAFTLELWYNQDPASPGSWAGLIAKRAWGCNYGINVAPGGNLQVYYQDTTIPGAPYQIVAIPAPSTNTWHHLAGTYQQINSSQVVVAVFVDGALKGTATLAGNLANTINSAYVAIGATYADGEYFYGLIDEVSIYNRALSSSEIQGIYNAGALGKCWNSDGSGMPDWWENKYFGHTGINPNGDADGDGLTNLQEYLLGTNPNSAAVQDSTGKINLNVYTPLK